MINDDQLQELYDKLFEVVAKESAEYNPMAVAGVCMSFALRLYKTALSDGDFDHMVDSISDSKHLIKSFFEEEKISLH